MNVLVDKNKLALLQGRLGVSSSEEVPQQPVASNQDPSPNHFQSPPSAKEDEGAHEIIDICGSDQGSKDKPLNNIVTEWPKSLLRYEEHSNNSNHSKHLRDLGEEDRKEHTPKRLKQDGVDPPSDGNNSRGPVTGMRKLETYFQSNGPSSFASSNRSLAAAKAASATAATGGAASGAAGAAGAAGATSTVSSSSTTHAVSTSSVTTGQQASSGTSVSITSSSFQSLSTSTSSQQNEKATAAIAAMTADFKKQNEQLRLMKEQFEQKSLRLEAEMRSSNEGMRYTEERNSKLASSLEDVYRRMAMQDARRRRDRLAQDNVRLGKIKTVRTSATSVGEVWEEGYALKELNDRCIEVAERRDELEKRRNRLKAMKRKYLAKVSAGNDAHSGTMENNSFYDATMASDGSIESAMDLEIISEEYALRTHMEQLKRDESALLEARHLLETEKAAHQKESKRCQSEDRSRFFKDLPCLNKRYLLLSLLGRGGFSEVWKALDLVELREVAVKISQLNPTWLEEKKQAYVKHVTREYVIHRDLNHPRVVLLFDVFEIDINSFATVLELCHGTDLDEKLKTQRIIPEKDAKTILMQIIFGLRYLNAGVVQPAPATQIMHANEDGGGAVDRVRSPVAMPPPATPRRRSIIHFDLKPANILFDSMGDVKITDFGLSKIMEEADEGIGSVELTSQGAGTYWYLPPECFERGDAGGPPRISNKVDVWSLGVIMYQMLFGKRPFGEGKSQERIWSEGIMLNATRVDFPEEGKAAAMCLNGGVPLVVPRVSDEGKDFIRACLTWDQKHRPDVLQLCQHPYLRPQANKKS